MFNYYKLEIIPIILNMFKVNNLVISGMPTNETSEQIFKFIGEKNIHYTIIEENKELNNMSFIKENPLNALPTLNNYDAIFLDDDPNWFTTYNELKIIKNSNDEFPLVFICNNIFPHKRRDTYRNPDCIPDEFKNDYSKTLTYDEINIYDNTYHAIEENNSKNGVLTAIEDFLDENKSINMMNIKLINGITILYPENNISKIRLGKISKKIKEYEIKYDEFHDNIFENQLLKNYVSKFEIFNEQLDSIQRFDDELNEKNKLLNDYENQIKIHDDELNYKNSQIEGYNSQINLKNSRIKHFESKLINSENEINTLNKKLRTVNSQVTSLKNEINQKEQNFKNKEQEYTNKVTSLKNEINQKEQNFKNKEQEYTNQINNSNSEINSLKSNIDQKEQNFKNKEQEYTNKVTSLKNEINQKEQNENFLNNHLEQAKLQIKTTNEQITIKNNQIKNKENELTSFKQQYAHQLSKLDNKEYCITCYKEEIENNKLEIEYLMKNTTLKKILSPLAYVYLIFKSSPHELYLNYKLYRLLKNSECFDIGFYLKNNNDLKDSNWCKYFSPELHYICNGFSEKRDFNKKYFNTNTKKELLKYIIECK